MLWSFCILLACQAVGEAVHAATGLPVPATIPGIAVLVRMLSCRGPQQAPAVLPAADIAVLTGIVGAILCTAVLDWCGVHNERARGLATGTAALGIGMACLLALAATAGAFSSLAISLAGLLGGIVLPTCLAHWAK